MKPILFAAFALLALAGCAAGSGGVIEPESKTKGSGANSPMHHAPKPPTGSTP